MYAHTQFKSAAKVIIYLPEDIKTMKSELFQRNGKKECGSFTYFRCEAHVTSQ